MKTGIVWKCMQCKEPIEDNEGYVFIDLAAVDKVMVQQRDWDLTHQFPTPDELARRPEDVSWQVMHEACDPEPEGDFYVFDVAEARTMRQIVERSADLFDTPWIPYTNWGAVLLKALGE